MARVSPTFRISFCLVSIALSVFSLAMALGLIPDFQASRLEGRRSFCEQLAIFTTLALQQQDAQIAEEMVQAAVHRNAEVLSAGLRESGESASDGQLRVEIGDHEKNWSAQLATGNPDFVNIPLYLSGRRWGILEVRFQPWEGAGWFSIFNHPVAWFYIFFTSLCTLGFYVFVRLLHRNMELSQSRVVPHRVRDTLNTLAEGVVILNKDGQIVMANHAFADAAGSSSGELEGMRVSDLAWSKPVSAADSSSAFPWDISLTAKESQTGVIVNLHDDEQSGVLSVNSMPILGDDGSLRGALASFDNLTLIEKKNVDLRRMLRKLRKSKIRIQEQNVDLQNLATKDPLTGCWNRRFFFETFASHWSAWERYAHHLGCVMVDIDHFKSINDNHGHSAGDQVLQQVSALLLEQLREGDLLCRYGGEEFCILLPGQEITGAMQMAERLRRRIEALRPINLQVTVSIGVSGSAQGAKSMNELVEQADKALYLAKRTGRNKVLCWSDAQVQEAQESVQNQHTMVAPEDARKEVPYAAVNVLLTTLHYRHPSTADHCRRVADLCAAAAIGILSNDDCYLLEMAALLHDIGKLGVPDAILLKPGPLSNEEWQIIKSHESIGEELLAVAFSCKRLSDIVRGLHYRFEGDSEKQSAPKGEEIPLPARFLAIADAFDSMVSEQVYRRRRSQEEAIQELKQHAGKQFDPQIVELFIQRIKEGNRDRNQTRDTSMVPG